MQLNAKANIIKKNHLKIIKVVDGDGLIVENIFNNQEFEIRFLGIDAPELKPCRKLTQDERETHLAAQFLMELGRKSLKYLLEIAPPNTNVSILIETENEIDLSSLVKALTDQENQSISIPLDTVTRPAITYVNTPLPDISFYRKEEAPKILLREGSGNTANLSNFDSPSVVTPSSPKPRPITT